MRSAALRLTLAVAAMAALPCAAFAQVYGGIGVAEAEFKPDRAPTFRPTALTGFVGKEINPNLAAELRLSAGMGSDDGVEVDHVLGAYVRGILPLARDVSLYGLLGVSRTKLKGGGGSVTDTGLSYGVGGDVNVGKSVAVGLEWTSLVRPSGYELNALTLLARFKF